MTLAGFAAFLDPPKEWIPAVLEALKSNGVSVVIMTGDNQYVTQKVAHDVGLATDRIVTGSEVDTMDDATLAYQAEHGAIFARTSPEQKNRVIVALKAHGRVVGLHRRRHQRRSVTARRGCRNLSHEWRRRSKGCRKDHSVRGGPDGLERWGNRRSTVLRQHHEVHHHEHQFQLRQYVQHGSGITLPVVPAHVADANSAEQLSLRYFAGRRSIMSIRPCCTGPSVGKSGSFASS